MYSENLLFEDYKKLPFQFVIADSFSCRATFINGDIKEWLQFSMRLNTMHLGMQRDELLSVWSRVV